jgi:hypothetical protein
MVMMLLLVVVVVCMCVSVTATSAELVEPHFHSEAQQTEQHGPVLHMPGQVMSWTFDGSRPTGMVLPNTQTLEIPTVMNQMKHSMHSTTQSPEVLALIRFEQDKQVANEEFIQGLDSTASKKSMFNSVYRTPDMATLERPALDHALQTEGLFAGAHHMTMKEFTAHMHQQHSQILHNNIVDRYVVSVQKGEERNALKDITDIAQYTAATAHSPAAPLTLVAMNEPTINTVLPNEHASYHRLLAIGDGTSSDPTSANYLPEGAEYSIYYQAKYLYITPDILTGLLTMLFLFFVIFTGLSCLGAIQGPSSFVNKNPVVGREA